MLRQALTAVLEPIKELEEVDKIVRDPALAPPPAHLSKDEPVKYKPDMYFTLPESMQALEREKSQCMRNIIAARSRAKALLKLQKPERISLTDALRAMNNFDGHGNPIPFSIGYITCNLEDGTGGEWRYMRSAFCSYQNASGTKNFTGKKAITKSGGARRANHWVNATRNIFPSGGNQLRCIHIWLILEFNGKEVVIGQAG